MTDALKQTLTIRVPVTIRHEVEMEYDRFCEDYMDNDPDEDSPTLDKRCRETWEAMIALYEKEGYVELDDIDGGECDESDVLNDYDDASDAFQDVVDSAIADLKQKRENEANRAEIEARAKQARKKMMEERTQRVKDAEEFAAWKKAKEEVPVPPPVKVEVPVPPPVKVEVPVSERGVDILVTALKCALTRIAELEQRVKELTEGV
jgi:hypothetical protein